MKQDAKKFKPADFEAKWQKKWESDKVFSPDIDTAKKPYYNLMMFPYPSAEGMHVGNMYAHTGADIHGRFRRMQGNDVFEPIGLDGFGIHSENYAMKVGRHPKEQAEISEKNFYRQMHATGSGFDWQRTLETYDPDYYKWTQWLFTQMFKAGLAYKDKASVNYCPSCKTVLSDEQVIAGQCERCGSIVEKKVLEQWFFRITQYAGRLLDNLPELDWTEKVKIAQTNWIGRSKGALIRFPIADFVLPNGEKPNFVLLHGFNGSPDKNFFPWIKEVLEKMGYDVQAPELPHADNPTEDEQVKFVIENTKINENTIILGHSLGAAVALKVLEKTPHQVAKLVLAGGFIEPKFKDDKNRPYSTNFNWDYDWDAIKGKVSDITVLHDSKDPVIPFDQASSLANKLGVNVEIGDAQEGHFRGEQEYSLLEAIVPHIKAFTTRPDTLFGATFMVIAPEHPIVNSLLDLESKLGSETIEKIKNYVTLASNKTEAERIADEDSGRGKTGVFSGMYVINPATNEKIPLWIADYVLASYGTGAIMAVPAHDQRDYDFAEKYNIAIKQVVMPSFVDTLNPPQEGKENTFRKTIIAIVKNPKTNKYLILRWKHHNWMTFVTGGVDEGEDLIEAAKREVAEETGYTDLRLVRELGGQTESYFYAAHKGVNRQTNDQAFLFELNSEARSEVSEDEQGRHEVVWMSEDEVEKAGLRHAEFSLLWERVKTGIDAYVGYGLLQNSGELDGYHSHKDADKIIEFISGNGWGEVKEQYHLRDWLISRQRYWGPPIPMIYCENCAKSGNSWFNTEEAQEFSGRDSSPEFEKERSSSYAGQTAGVAGWYPVPDSDLPVLLPDIKDFKPAGEGKSPLANHPEFYETTCPGCGGKAFRETDVSDTFLDSAWYFLRYLATDWDDLPFPSLPIAESKLQLLDSGRGKLENVKNRSRFLPVNIYIGGAEHSVLHLLYARFVTMVLHDLGYIDFEEPFTKFFAHGLLIKEGAKMSKSKGNVIVPDEYIDKYGADTLRSYLMFLGPFNQGGDFYDTGIEGMFRFLRRIWHLIENRTEIGEEDENITRARHKTIAGVTKDMEEFGYNTALAKLMEFYNLITEGKGESDKIKLNQDTVEAILKMLAPFAPHMTEELWQSHLEKEHDSFNSIHLSSWPTFDPSLIIDEQITIAIQVNGKRRGEISVDKDKIDDRTVVEKMAKEEVFKYLNSPVKKVIYVPGKILNFVI